MPHTDTIEAKKKEYTWEIAMRVYGYERVYNIKALSKEEAFEKAKDMSMFRGEGCQFELDEAIKRKSKRV